MDIYDNRQQRATYTGTEFIEGFALLAGALWLGGAIFLGSMAYIGGHNGAASPASNQTPVAESNDTPTTEPVQTVDAPAQAAPEGETPAMP